MKETSLAVVGVLAVVGILVALVYAIAVRGRSRRRTVVQVPVAEAEGVAEQAGGLVDGILDLFGVGGE